jgi:flagellar basal-body rod modification protein FlgD
MNASAVNSTDPTAASAASAAAQGLGNQLNGNDFITLLVAQLKQQDPTNPMDPTQFVSQLVQFNSLEQLISINQELQPAPSSTLAPPTTNAQ